MTTMYTREELGLGARQIDEDEKARIHKGIARSQSRREDIALEHRPEDTLAIFDNMDRSENLIGGLPPLVGRRAVDALEAYVAGQPMIARPQAAPSGNPQPAPSPQADHLLDQLRAGMKQHFDMDLINGQVANLPLRFKNEILSRNYVGKASYDAEVAKRQTAEQELAALKRNNVPLAELQELAKALNEKLKNTGKLYKGQKARGNVVTFTEDTSEEFGKLVDALHELAGLDPNADK